MFEWIQRLLQARRVRRITYANAQERVSRGAAYLDDVDPGWHARVDPETLELASGRACVLGQLHGDFRLGLGRAHLLSLSSAPRPSLSPVTYGFRCVQDVPAAEQDRDYAFLDRAWQAEIRKRRPPQAVDSPSKTPDSQGPDSSQGPAFREARPASAAKTGAGRTAREASTPAPASV